MKGLFKKIAIVLGILLAITALYYTVSPIFKPSPTTIKMEELAEE